MRIHMLLFFSDFGIFNVSVLAKNSVTEIAVFDDVMSIVTGVSCGMNIICYIWNKPDVVLSLSTSTSFNPYPFNMSYKYDAKPQCPCSLLGFVLICNRGNGLGLNDKN